MNTEEAIERLNWCANSLAISGIITCSKARELTGMTPSEQSQYFLQIRKADPEWFGYLQDINGRDAIPDIDANRSE